MASARYALVAAKSRWEEQGFHFEDTLPNYGLEQFVHNRLRELGWFRFARQPARANYNWVLEFYANNEAGEDFSMVRGRRVPATVAIINDLLGLPNDAPSFYAMLEGFEEEDHEVIKNILCLPNTEWNTTGRNPKSGSRLSLLPEAKLWNTFVKRNLMPTSHNQTVDRTRLLLINIIMTGFRVNVGRKDRLDQGSVHEKDECGRRYTTQHGDATPPASPVAEADVRVEDSAPPSPAEPATPAEHQRTPPPSPPVIPVSSHTTTHSPATTPAAPAERTRGQTPDTPLGSTPSSSPLSPPAPAQSEEATLPLPFMLLQSQLQRIEARQLNFQEEFKVFQTNLLKFLNFQFPSSAAFFGQSSTPPPQPSSFAAAAQPSTHTSDKEGATEEIHFSSDDENDIFDWQSPRDHLLTLGPSTTTPAPAAPILSTAPTPTTATVAERPTPESPARKRGKATAGRTISRDHPSSPDEEDADQRPAKRRRRYHVITADSDDDGSS
ncbi:hypothetical protein V6N13_110674 [Hibiscus sabdariffa]